MLSVTNGTGGVTGTVIETTPGAPGLLPNGGTVTIGGLSNAGFTVTYGGTLAGSQPGGATVSLLSFTNLTSGPACSHQH